MKAARNAAAGSPAKNPRPAAPSHPGKDGIGICNSDTLHTPRAIGHKRNRRPRIDAADILAVCIVIAGIVFAALLLRIFFYLVVGVLS